MMFYAEECVLNRIVRIIYILNCFRKDHVEKKKQKRNSTVKEANLKWCGLL